MLTSYQNEQARLEEQRIEAANRNVAAKIVRDTYQGFFTKLRNITPTSGSFTVTELLNGPEGKYVSDVVKKDAETKNSKSVLGCRDQFSDKLTAAGYTFGSPEKKTQNLYTVSTIWKGDPNDSSDRQSRGLVSVDVEKKQIVKFDCSEQDAINNQRKVQAEIESSKR